MSKDRLLIVTPSLGGGGAEHHLVRILPALATRFDVHLATLKHRETLGAGVPDNVTRHSIASLRWLVAANRLRALSRRLRPAISFAVQDTASIPLLLARATLGDRDRSPAVVSVQTALSVMLARSRPRTRFLVRQAIKHLYPGASAVIAASRGVADDLCAIAPIADDRLTVIPNASVLESVTSRAAEACPHPFFADAGGPVLVACGRLIEAKDYPTLLRAVALVRARHPARIIILGDGPLAAALRALAHELGINDASFMGYVENPSAYFSRSSVFVLSSQWEGFGNVVAEALACGVPVVSTDCPHGPAEILGHGQFGLLVPPGDPVALADAIVRLLDAPERRKSLAAAGLVRSLQFTVARSGRAHLELLERVLAENRASASRAAPALHVS